MRKPSYTVPVAVGVLAVGSLVMMNVISQKNAPKTEEQQEAEQHADEAKATPAAPAVETKTAVPVAGGDELVMKDGSFDVGPATATKKIVVGYEWTPAIQADPGAIQKIANMVQQAAPEAKISVVNVDENPGVPVGIQVDGKVVAPIGDDGIVPPAQISAVVQALSAKK